MSVSLCQIRNNYAHLRHNVALLRASGKPIMPIIKADAYGHGLQNFAEVLRRDGVDHLGVGTVAEAVLLRRGGFDGVIVALLGAVSDEDILALHTYSIVPLVHEWTSLNRIADTYASGHKDKPVSMAIKCDTGMGRLGFPLEEMARVTEFLSARPQLNPEFLLSHLAAADTRGEEDFTRKQAETFREAGTIMRRTFPEVTLSLGNSACLLAFPELVGDLARPGIALYGGNPLHGTSREILGAGLETVMEISTPVLSVHPLKAGQTLGYGRTFLAPRDMLVAVAGIGYADGYRRGPAPGTAMTVHGRRALVVGRVAMQMTCLDITGITGVQPGDPAFIMGGEGQAVGLQELADWWETIPHEVTCILGKNRLL